MISDEHKIIFIHIPKTAGTSIENVLFKPKNKRASNDLWGGPNQYQSGALQHLMSSNIIKAIGMDVFNQYFTFSFSRNPWDKIVSQYHFTVQRRKDLQHKIGINENSSFKEYINKLFSVDVYIQWEQQYKFLYIDGKCVVDFIGKFENLQQDFDIVCDKIGMSRQQLPHKNKSKHKHYTEYYDDETRQIVAEKYAKDIECFGYKFGE